MFVVFAKGDVKVSLYFFPVLFARIKESIYLYPNIFYYSPSNVNIMAVSYTHLDVYKRQPPYSIFPELLLK